MVILDLFNKTNQLTFRVINLYSSIFVGKLNHSKGAARANWAVGARFDQEPVPNGGGKGKSANIDQSSCHQSNSGRRRLQCERIVPFQEPEV
jgi:hypothetical protein